jgi:hypothetical protein
MSNHETPQVVQWGLAQSSMTGHPFSQLNHHLQEQQATNQYPSLASIQSFVLGQVPNPSLSMGLPLGSWEQPFPGFSSCTRIRCPSSESVLSHENVQNQLTTEGVESISPLQLSSLPDSQQPLSLTPPLSCSPDLLDQTNSPELPLSDQLSVSADSPTVDESVPMMPSDGTSVEFHTFKEAAHYVNSLFLVHGYNFQVKETYKNEQGGRLYCDRWRKADSRVTTLPGTRQADRSSKNSGCTAKFSLKKIPNGFEISASSLDHNHDPMEPSKVAAYRRELLRPHDDELRRLLEENISPAHAKSILSKRHDTMFCYQDIYNAYQRIKSQSTTLNSGRNSAHVDGLDEAVRLVEELQRRRNEEGWRFDLDFKDGRLSRVFFMSPEMQKYFNSFGEVALFDTTFGKNKFKLPVAFLSVVDGEGFTRIAAVFVLSDETTDSFLWCMNCLPTLPTAIFTDGDKAMDAAFSQLDMYHFLCCWHLYKNILKNLSKKVKAIDEFMRRFQALRNLTSEEEFNNCRRSLLKDFPESSSYMEKEVFPLSTLWARCYMKSVFTVDLNTTSRSESVHSLISPFLSSDSSLIDLLDVVEQVVHNHNFEASFKAYRKTQVILSGVTLGKLSQIYGSDLISVLSRGLTTFCQSLLISQMDMAASCYRILYQPVPLSNSVHTAVDLEDGDKDPDLCHDTFGEQSSCSSPDFGESNPVLLTVLVQHRFRGQVQRVTKFKNGALHCTCGYPVRMGCLCRHIWCAWLETGQIGFFLNQISPRWHTSLVDMSRICFSPKILDMNGTSGSLTAKETPPPPFLPDTSVSVWTSLSARLVVDKPFRMELSPSRISKFQKKSTYANLMALAKQVAERATELSEDACKQFESQLRQSLAHFGLPLNPNVVSAKGRPKKKRLTGSEEQQPAKKSARLKKK